MTKRKKGSPVAIQKLYEEFLHKYLAHSVIALPECLSEEEYKTAMDSITKAMSYAFLNGYEKGFE